MERVDLHPASQMLSLFVRLIGHFEASRHDQISFDHVHELAMRYGHASTLDEWSLNDESWPPESLYRGRRLSKSGTAHDDPSPPMKHKGFAATPAIHAGTNEHCPSRENRATTLPLAQHFL
jgi:hypothetical protein